MSFYAFEGGVSTDEVDGSIQITDEQHTAAIEGMMDGKIITIAGGFAIVDPPPVPDEPAAAPSAPAPFVFASMGVIITDGLISTVEMAAQLQGAFYEDGWLVVAFAEPQEVANYLVFAQCDVPARIEQFKDTGAFELVFSDAHGDPVEPGRIDIQILKVR